ncbi:MAG: hypothetical protein GY820_47700 [Gammaproteobacteria bacterium]|nr:hypothetical protein [Gammaproteobacteria bacterium]
MNSGPRIFWVRIGRRSANKNLAEAIFLGWLAFNDALLCLFYALIFSVKVLSTRLSLLPLYKLFWGYRVPAFALSKMVQLAVPYMLILATTQRLVSNSKKANESKWFRYE